MSIEKLVEEMGITLPDFGPEGFYGQRYGKMRPWRRVGNLLFLSGHVPEQENGEPLHPGQVGRDITVEQGYEAARLSGINALAGIKQALGNLDDVVALVRTLNFVVCDPAFTDPNLIASGMTDLFAEVYGPERGIAPRATIGVTCLANNHSFETWMTLEVR